MGIYSRYPFLRGAGKYANTGDIKDSYVEYARRVLLQLLEKGTAPKQDLEEIEVQTYFIICIIAKVTGNPFIRRKYVEYLGKRFESDFLDKGDCKFKNVREELYPFFDTAESEVEVKLIADKYEFVRIHVNNYLNIVEDKEDQNTKQLLEKGIDDPRFKLVNQTLSQGYIYLQWKEWAYLLRLKLERKLTDKIQTMPDFKRTNLLDELIKELYDKYPTHKEYYTLTPSTNIPPCVKSIMEKVEKEAHLTHNERIFIATFWYSRRKNEDWLVDNVFSKLSDYKEKVTRYQLRSVKRLYTASCETAMTQGICKNKDVRCGRIKNPYFY